MPSSKFRFVSPGVEFREIDNSALPRRSANNIGPVVVGRSKKGPAMRPITVNSLSDFIDVFGQPSPGVARGDVWRSSEITSPSYGAYAAEAWLRSNSPLTFVRLLGEEHSNAAAAGKAGWETTNTLSPGEVSSGGAYGLFMIDSGSAGSALTGALAAVFYLQEGSVALSGEDRDGNAAVTGSSILLKSSGANKEFTGIIYDSSGNEVANSKFNFNKSSDKYIRKVFNTNPILTNTTIIDSADQEKYWLGETFDRHLSTYVTSSTAGSQFACILGLEGPSAVGEASGGSFKYGTKNPKTGWIFAQDVGNDTATFEPRQMTKLFRFHSLYGGTWDAKNVKISIQNIKASTKPDSEYGTFSVIVRDANDSDNNPEILEAFTNLTLDPLAPNFIAAAIGDKEMVWDESTRRYKEYGIYDNQSQYIRVEMNETVMDGLNNVSFLPFGFYGPERHKPFAVVSGSSDEVAPDETDAQTAFTDAFVVGSAAIPRPNIEGTEFVNVGAEIFTGSFEFPELALRDKATDGGLPNPKKAYFGIQNSVTAGSTNADEGYGDYLRSLSGDYVDLTEGDYLEYSFMFTLDDISGSSTQLNDITAPAEYVSGSRKAGTSISANNGWEAVLDNGHNRFTMPLYGAFDGTDVTEMNPFRNSVISNNPTNTTDYVYNTYRRAIDSVRDAEVLDHSVASVPGLTNEGLTGHLANVCRDRADSLAIVDPKGGYTAREETSDSFSSRLGTTSTIVSNIKSRGIDNSYAATYDPWVLIRDSFNGARVIVPPSVVALGAMSNTEANEALWFAPAGFTRGGLTEGASGLNVVGVTRQLFQDDRDDLYEVGVNPIAKFPNEGLVIWGQKTLQRTESATDRVNVRRLMNYLKKTISRIARTIVFEQNVRETWNSFTASAELVLKNTQSKFGINRFRFVLDESTTTDDLIDRNEIRAKVIVEPTKSIEFIGIDFVITNSGASFAD